MNPEKLIDRVLKTVAEQSIDKASQVLTKMLQTSAKIELKRVVFEDVTTVTQSINEGNREVIAATIELVGSAPFRFLFWVSTDDAYKLTDLFLGQQIGTTTSFDEYTSSIVQEIANILSSAVTNVFVANYQVSMKPEPPNISRDFSGSIFEEFIMGVAMERNDILLIESRFQIANCEMDCRMYLLPMTNSDEALSFAAGVEELETTNKGFKILVIDDSQTDRDVIKIFLENVGYQVVTVASAQEGLKRMVQEHFDLTLCDFNMPQMNGEEFIDHVRKDSVLQFAVVLIITSEENNDIKVRLLKKGANDFLSKGAAREEILARIETHLRARANAKAFIGGVWTDALVKVFNLLKDMREEIENGSNNSQMSLEKIKQMQQAIDQVVSKIKNN